MSIAKSRIPESKLTVTKVSIQIRHFVADLNDERTNLSSTYQRPFKWNKSLCSNLIETIMKRSYIPAILQYNLQNEEYNEKHSNECIDGQNRSRTIQSFVNGEYILSNNKKILPYWYHKETDTYIFYQENENTKKFKLENDSLTVDYMNKEEKEHFSNYTIDISRIDTQMSYKERCLLFTNLQTGVPVRNSDLDKNRLDCLLISSFNEEGILPLYEKKYIEFLINAPRSFTTYHFMRCFAIYKNKDLNEKILEAVMINDTKYTNLLKNKNSWVYKEQEVEPFIQGFTESLKHFFEFIKENPRKYPIFRFISIWCHFLINPNDFQGENKKKMLLFLEKVSKGEQKDNKKLWLRKEDNKERCQDYFMKCWEEIKNFQAFQIEEVTFKPRYERTQFTKKVRKLVWEKWCGDQESGQCWLCEKPVKKSSRWHCGHINAVSEGGSNDLENVIVLHSQCNLKQGKMNAFEYKRMLSN